MKTLFKVAFEADTYELKQNNLGKEVLLRNEVVIATKRNLFSFGNKFIIDSPHRGPIQLEFRLNLSSAICEVRISMEGILLAEYEESLEHLTPKWLQEKSNEEAAIKPSHKMKKIIFAILSMGVAIILWGLIYSWTIAPVLVLVILMHELGHLIAMSVFGYKNLGMIFAPPFGAIATGYKVNEIVWQKFVIYLSGPLPGILLGFLLLYFDIQIISIEISKDIIIMLLALNYFNMLPISPLDGGNIVELMFLHKAPRIQLVLAGIGALFLGILGVIFKDLVTLIIAALFGIVLISRIKSKVEVQVENTELKAWVRWVAALIYLGLWFIVIVVLI